MLSQAAALRQHDAGGRDAAGKELQAALARIEAAVEKQQRSQQHAAAAQGVSGARPAQVPKRSIAIFASVHRSGKRQHCSVPCHADGTS